MHKGFADLSLSHLGTAPFNDRDFIITIFTRPDNHRPRRAITRAAQARAQPQEKSNSKNGVKDIQQRDLNDENRKPTGETGSPGGERPFFPGVRARALTVTPTGEPVTVYYR